MKSLLAAALIILASSASAATINLSGYAGGHANIDGGSATFNVDGFSGTIQAGSTHTYDGYPLITTTPEGLGVRNGPRDGAYFASGNQIDGYGYPTRYSDWLTVTFDSAVRLVSATLGYFSPYRFDWDDAWYSVDGGSFTRTEDATYSFRDVIATSFTVRAFGYNDDFVLNSFTVQAAPVPLPASALLLLGGLAGFGLMRRRKQKA